MNGHPPVGTPVLAEVQSIKKSVLSPQLERWKYIYIYIGEEVKYGMIFKTFFLDWLVQFLKKNKKKHDKSEFSWLALLLKHFFEIKIQPNMSDQEKKRQRIYDMLYAETKPQFLCLPYSKRRKKIYRKRAF